MRADVAVDAFPGEHFSGRIARVSPILDPATRTAQIEVDIDNNDFRLKPGMYAKVTFTVERRDNILSVPTNAIVDVGGKKGVFVPADGNVAKFQAVTLGMSDPAQIEIASGLQEGTRVISTGATALRDGDRIVLLGEGQRSGERGAQGGAGGQRDGGRRPNGGEGQGGGRRGGAPTAQ
jgi:RND family efflux transporter MFP subunit